MKQKIELYDTTLRDGAQGRQIKFSSEDQLRVVRALDEFGVAYIEGGQPGSNPKAAELFERTKDMQLKHAKMVAFGSTRHPKSAAEDDANIKALLQAGTDVITIFAKSSPTHAKEILRVSLDDNIKLTGESVAYLKAQGKRVILDGEHFFDGYFEDSEYALSVLQVGWNNGAEVLVLCDTNGGRLPSEIATATRAVRERLPSAQIGIHTHNDAGCAVANTLAAVEAGAMHIQGTINGYGERTGNANLVTIIPTIQLKMGVKLVSDKQLARLTHVSYLVAELANMNPRDSDPYVGRDSFTHKGGMHADAVHKLKSSYEHIEPELVGNRTHIAVSEVSGRSSLLQKAEDFGMTLERDAPETREVLKRVKDMESEGYEFEGADASLELLMRRAKGHHKSFFTLLGYRVSVEGKDENGASISEATVKVELPDGTRMHTAAEGAGPVDALNNALRTALEGTYPELKEVHLEDYKVRILDGQAATRAKTRVFIESTDGESEWDTVGVSENIIAASVHALLDSIEYKLYSTTSKRKKAKTGAE